MDILQYTFFQNALIGALLASILCGFVGTYIVTRRLVFISGGITHASFGGIGIGVFAGINPILSAMVFAILSAFGVQWVSRKKDVRKDSAIAMFWTLGMSVGIICCFLTPGFMPDLPSFLFGSILAIDSTDLWLLASGRSYPVCCNAVHLSAASYPDHRIRQHLCQIATSAGYCDRIYDDDAHRHDHRGNHQDGGHRTCHQSAHHTTDDCQPLHLQLQAHDRSQHRDRLHRLHRGPLCQLSAQCAIRCNHHLRQHHPVCSSKDTGSQKALRLSHALKEKFIQVSQVRELIEVKEVITPYGRSGSEETIVFFRKT